VNAPRLAPAVRLTAALVALAWSGRAPAAPPSPPAGVPVERQVLILTRALAYDENLAQRAGDEFVVAVLSRAASAGADPTADAATTAFKNMAGVKIHGLPVRAIHLSYSGASTLAAAIDGEGIDALYLCPGVDGDVTAVLEVSRRKKVITMASKEQQVNKGAALGVFNVDNKPTIFVNLPGSKAEGAAFTSDLLRLAKVIR
jgi:hypothetical protein